METRQLIDYASQDDGAKFREALYASIHDKVSAHIDAKKMEVAKNLIAPQEVEQSVVQDDSVENT
jgi:hypothetical protein